MNQNNFIKTETARLERQIKEVETERERLRESIKARSIIYSSQNTFESFSMVEKSLNDFNKCSIEWLELNNEIIKLYSEDDAENFAQEISNLELRFQSMSSKLNQSFSDGIDHFLEFLSMLSEGKSHFDTIAQMILLRKRSIIQNISHSQNGDIQ